MKTRTNQPVYGALGKKQVEDVKNIIQADKDILSQIRYTEDDEIVFPKGIIPLAMYISELDDFVYFDYKNQNLIDTNGDVIEADVYFDENQLWITLSVSWEVLKLEYINFSYEDTSTIEPSLNTYYIYHPVTSGGTKLYKHIFNCKNSSDVVMCSLEAISTSPTPIAYADFETYILKATNYITLYLGDTGWTVKAGSRILATAKNTSTNTIYLYFIDLVGNKPEISTYGALPPTSMFVALEDIVTEL